ncbi:hypothetical protein INR49_017948 [Caranx melampygus]|nr:hypothetical protein INR49_017948 [Caranx melampygus]
MTQFEEVLEDVRLVLTCACPAEIHTLLEGLVEEQIISEAYSKSLSLDRLIEGIDNASVHSNLSWEARPGQINPQGPIAHQGHLHQVLKFGASNLRGSAIAFDDQYSFKFNSEITELLRTAESMQKQISDSERTDGGNSEGEREWLEKVEEAARRIAVPLWQHWDRGQKMLLPLVSCITTGCATSDSHEARCPELNMEEEMELAVACSSLDLYTDKLEFTDTGFTPDTRGATDSLKGLCLSAFDSLAMTGSNTDHFNYYGAAGGNVSPVEACTATDTNNNITDTCLEGHLSACCVADGTVDSNDDLMRLTDYVDAGFRDVADLFSPCTQTDTHTNTHDDLLYSQTDHSITSGVLDNLENVIKTAYGTVKCSTDGSSDFHENKEDKERVDPHWGAKMHEVDQELLTTLDLEDLPGDVDVPTELNTPGSFQQSPENKLKNKPQREEAEDEPAVTLNTDTGMEPHPVEAAGPTTPPPRIVHLHHPIQIIIPDRPGYVQTLRLSPSVIGLPVLLPLLVPATSPPCKRQVQPPSPEMSPCKESPLPQSPIVRDIPQVVQDYIQEIKSHMSQTCQDMEEGLRLNSHYVDVQVSRREVLRSGKNTNKCLDKELIIMGDTDRQRSLLGRSQIFEGSNGDKSKRCILLFGNAGMGKTTLIKKLCLDWSKDCIPQFDFVFLLDGKALTLTKPTFSLQTLLLNLSSFAPSCMDPESVYAQILAAPKRVLIIFDGFDELRDYESLLQTQEKDLITMLQKDSKAQTYTVRQLYSAILQRVLLSGCTLLLATRPRGTASQLLRRADSFLEVCGFTPSDLETYLSQYFTDPSVRASALDCLKNCSYLHLLCWNPGLCRLVCMVLEESKGVEGLPRTLTGLCHQVLCLKMDKDSKSAHSQAEDATQTSLQAEEETQAQISGESQTRCHRNTQVKGRAQVRARSRTQRPKRAKEQEKEEDEVDGEEMKSGGMREEERMLLSQLSSLAWEGVKANSSVLPTGRTLSAKVKAFGLRTRLLVSHTLRTRPVVSSGEMEEGGGQDKDEIVGRENEDKREERGMDIENTDAKDEHIVLWANPFLQSYLAGVHLSLSRTLSDRNFLQTLPFQSGPKGRRRPQREELELTQRFTVGLLFHDRTELQSLHSNTETSFRDMVVNKQALVTNTLKVLEACHYVYEASFTHGDDSRGICSVRLDTHLAENLPEVLTFHGVPLNPPDVFTVQNVLERGGSEGRSFCLDLEDSGIHVSGLRAVVGLNSINTYRACIADVITLWEQLEQSGEDELLQVAVSKLNIHPLKATQNSKIGDKGAEKLADAVASLCSLEILNLSQNCIGDHGVKKLTTVLSGLPRLHCLSLYSNVISDEGAESLAAVLPHMASLTELDVKYNKLTDVGAQSLGASLRKCKKIKTLSFGSFVNNNHNAMTVKHKLPVLVDRKATTVSNWKDVFPTSLTRECSRWPNLRRTSASSSPPPPSPQISFSSSGPVVSLEITLKHIQLRVRVIRDRGRVGEHPEVHQRLVHVLRQKHYPHIKDDVLHQKGIVEDQDVHKEQAQIKHIWEIVQERFHRI